MPTTPTQPSNPAATPPKKGRGKKSGQGDAYQTVDFDRFVDKRIEKTRRVVKMADLVASLAILLSGVISLLLLAAIAEHWLVPGGFGTNERTGLWATLLIGSGVYFARYVFPLLTHRVNKLYAADELERESPELKNSLVNLLQLRGQENSSPVIQQMLEQQAAERLAVVDDHGPDLGPLVRVGYLLAGIIVVTGLYIVLSPKDFFASAQRVILPWSELAAPSRVAIEDLSPGDTIVSQGDRLPISLRIIGLEPEETAELIYTTADGRVVEKRLSLVAEEGSIRYTTELPASQASLGLQSDLKYRIEAGDARTRDYRVEVLTTPTIAPESIRYVYPEYTGFVNRTVEGGGDLRAIEGTRVILTTQANMPIESAQIDFHADGRPDVRMKSDGQSATATFLMKRRGDAIGFSPEISNYVLRFTSLDGKTNRKPALYQREVLADLPPEARLLFPEEPVRSVRLDEAIEIAVEARDPDFALSGVWLRGEADSKQVLNEWLLKPIRRDQGHKGKYVTSHWLTPRKLGLVGGQTLDYWVEAADNRQPSPNRNRSEAQQLIIVADSDSGNPSENGEPNQEGQSGEGDPQEGDRGEGEKDEGQNGEGQSGDNSPDSNRPNQGDSEGEESNQGSGSENSSGNNASNNEADQQEANESPEQRENSEANQDAEGIQGKGEEDAQGKRQEPSGSGEGTAMDQQQEDPSESDSSNQGGGNQRDRARDPNQEQGKENSEGDGSGGGEQVQTKDDSPVADDGSDDGAAFDKIREHLAKKREATEEERNSGDPNRQESTGDQGQNADRPESGDTKQGEARDPTGEDPQRDERPSPEDPNENDASENKSGKQSDSQSSESTSSAERGQDSKPNEGPRQGTGSSGQNQAADDGSGQSGDRGEGESTGNSGNQQSSNDNQNRSSDNSASEAREGGRLGESGESSEGENASGDANRENDQQGDGQRRKGGKPSDGDATSTGKEEKDSPDSEGSQSNRQGAGESESNQNDNVKPPSDGDPQGPSHGSGSEAFDRPEADTDEGEPGGDEANLDYARKQTDLVLDELSDQMEKQQIDQELLDELGWSEEDLERFVNRWQKRKRQATSNQKEGKSELDAALRSLGLSPDGQRIQGTSPSKEDSLRDLRQGKRSTIPPALRERLQRYNRGVSRDESRPRE